MESGELNIYAITIESLLNSISQTQCNLRIQDFRQSVSRLLCFKQVCNISGRYSFVWKFDLRSLEAIPDNQRTTPIQFHTNWTRRGMDIDFIGQQVYNGGTTSALA